MTENKIFTLENKKEEKFLRQKTQGFTFPQKGEIAIDDNVLKKRDVQALILKMRRTMREAKGIGLSANQIGLPYKLFIAEVPSEKGEPKFYAVFNPEIEKASGAKEVLEEGCLSVPNTYGEVLRHRSLTLRGFDRYGKPLKIKAWGLLARVIQHEVDHLNGILFIDRTKHVYKVPRSERLQKFEK